MSRKENAMQHIANERKACNDIVTQYNERMKSCATKEDKKALRKSLRIARVKRTLNTCVMLDALLSCCDSIEKIDTSVYNSIVSITHESVAREKFIITRNDDIMSLLMRYDNFSMKKVLKFCEAHKIAFNAKTKEFNFTNAIDILDSYDSEDEDSEDEE